MNSLKKITTGLLAISLLAGCGASSTAASTASTEAPAAAESTAAAAVSDDILTIGTTNQMSTVNPLTQNWNFIDLYATSLQFLPLVQIDKDYNVVPQLTDSITTDDNLTYNVKISDKAVWSDGEPVTSDDVIWTIIKMTSPEVANQNFDFSNIKGLEEGTSPEGAESVDGLIKVDDKNLQIVMNNPMSLNTFINNIGTWVTILPKHVLEDIPTDQLSGNDWFNHPTVVDGPYMLKDIDLAHYASYEANDNYFLGAPKIKKLNIQVYDGSALVAALQSGEVDFTAPATADIPYQDRETLEGLSDVTTTYSDAITNEMTFFNAHNLPDANVRKAIVEAIDRQTIVSSLLPKNGVAGDGWVSPVVANFYDADKMESIPYDPDDAKKLLDEAGFDYSREIQWYVNSGDTVLVNAAQIAQQQLAAVGLKVKVNTVDFDTLTGQIAGSDQYDMFSVQYTITPIDYYADVYSLADSVYGPDEDTDEPARSWTGDFYDEDLDKVLTATQTADDAGLKDLYTQMQNITVEQVPMFPLYYLGNSGSVSSRLKNATPTFFGSFNNIQDWEFAD